MQMQGMAEKIFTLGLVKFEVPAPKFYEKFFEPLDLCPCRMPLALTLQRKNKMSGMSRKICYGDKESYRPAVQIEGYKKLL